MALGLKPGTTLEEFEQAILDKRAEELLNWVDVHQGDMLYVAAGTVHTIGGGLILVETQQTSDITYRLYDYGRPRELHIAEGLAATKLHTNAGKVVRDRSDTNSVLVRSPFFQVEKTKLREALHAEVTAASPHIVVAIDGAGIVESEGMEPSVLRPAKLWSFPPLFANTQCVRSGSSRLCACRCLPEMWQNRRQC